MISGQRVGPSLAVFGPGSVPAAIYFSVTHPPSPLIFRIIKLAGKREVTYWNQQLAGKILNLKDLADYCLGKSFEINEYRYGSLR